MKRFQNYNQASKIVHSKQEHDFEWKYRVKEDKGSFIIEVTDMEGRLVGII